MPSYHTARTQRRSTRLLSLLLLTLISGCSMLTTETPRQQRVKFSELDGWSLDQAIAVKPALMKSCRRLNRSVLTRDSPWGSHELWESLCKELRQTPDRQLKDFFEQNFSPVRVAPHKKGLFTAYYSPVIAGSLTPSDTYTVPLLKLPQDLVNVCLSDFGLAKQRLVGKVEKGYLKPYPSRAQIERQKTYKSDVLLWLNNSADKFFLQVQGSGNVQLPDGKIMHVSYAGNNGHTYVPIGRILLQQGELVDVSMQTLRDWLEKNPGRSQWLMNQNPRYIFFDFAREGAITSQGVPATSQRTLAVDPQHVPLGLPVWLDTRLSATGERFQRLMVAQDTGSAIKGPARGDIYMGFGKEAALLAGPQQEPGKLYVLIPRQ